MCHISVLAVLGWISKWNLFPKECDEGIVMAAYEFICERFHSAYAQPFSLLSSPLHSTPLMLDGNIYFFLRQHYLPSHEK